MYLVNYKDSYIAIAMYFRYIPYIGNHPQKKSFPNYLLCCGSRENFRDSGNLMYKDSFRNKKCKKTFTNASRFMKFANFFFCGRFPIYGISLNNAVFLYDLSYSNTKARSNQQVNQYYSWQITNHFKHVKSVEIQVTIGLVGYTRTQ